MPPKPLKRKGPGPGLEPSPKRKKVITFTKCDPTLAFTDAKKPRPQRFDPVAPHVWRDKIQEGCKTAFARLEMRDDPRVRDAILRRIEAGHVVDTLVGNAPCFTVHRGNLNSKSPFQIQACGARIVAQKAIYAAYCNVTTEDMGTWQVRQKCLHGDNTWWCFEPTHLTRCARDHVSASLIKHPIPGPPDAVYLARYRKSRARVPEVKRVKEEYSNHSSPAPSSPDSESTLSAYPYDTYASIGTSALSYIDPPSSSEPFEPFRPAGHLTLSCDSTATSCSEDEDIMKASSPESEEIELPVSPPMQPFMHVSQASPFPTAADPSLTDHGDHGDPVSAAAAATIARTIDGLLDSAIGDMDDIHPMDLPSLRSLAMTSV